MMKKKFLNHAPKTVALVCMGPSVVNFLTDTLTQEFDHKKFADEVWVINMSSNCFWHDVVFWMDDLEQQKEFKQPLIEALNARGKPVITSKRYPDLVKSSYDYPIEEICKMPVGPQAVPIIDILGKPYLNNGVAMAIAYALFIGVKTLKVYGADFSYPNRDYAESGRACVECWITISSFHGMDIALSQDTSLMDAVKDQGLYGFKEQPSITLPDGRVFQYKRLDPSKNGEYKQYHSESVQLAGSTGYVAEDSSGVTDVIVPVSVPGSNGSDKPARRRGRPRKNRELKVVASSEAAVDRPGESLRPNYSVGCAEDNHPAANGNGADDGAAHRESETPVLLRESPLYNGPQDA